MNMGNFVVSIGTMEISRYVCNVGYGSYGL